MTAQTSVKTEQGTFPRANDIVELSQLAVQESEKKTVKTDV